MSKRLICIKKGIETAPQNKYTAVLNPLTLLSLICARSLSFVLFCMLLLQQNERKKESEREGEYKSTASPPPPHTHTTTLLLPHIHTFSLTLYTHCFVRRLLLLHSLSHVCWQTPCAPSPPPLGPLFASSVTFSSRRLALAMRRNASSRVAVIVVHGS